MENECIIELFNILETNHIIYDMMKQCPYEILKNISIKEYKKGEFLLEQGNKKELFYIIVEGIFDIYTVSESGKKYLIQTYTNGDYIGELEISHNKPYVSTVKARGCSKLIEIKRNDFLKWIDIDRNFSQYLIRTLCKSTYALCENTSNNTLYTLKQRICQYLIESINKSCGSDKFYIKIKTDNLGDKMGVTQRSINRVLKQLKEIGVIDIKNSNVIVKDYDLLINQRDYKFCTRLNRK